MDKSFKNIINIDSKEERTKYTSLNDQQWWARLQKYTRLFEYTGRDYLKPNITPK